MKQESFSESKTGFTRALSVLFTALFTGVVMFLVIVSALVYFSGPSINDAGITKIFLILVSVVAVSCLLAAFSIYRKRVSALVNSSAGGQEKLNIYRAALITYLALCEGAALFSIITFFLTGSYWLPVITIVMLAAMFAKKPSRQRIIRELQLNWEEEQLL